MQVQRPLNSREEFVARELTVVLRSEVRSTGQAAWKDLDAVLTAHRRFSAHTRAEAVAAVRHGFYRGNFRFDLFFTPDATRADGYRYDIILLPHLCTNRRGE